MRILLLANSQALGVGDVQESEAYPALLQAELSADHEFQSWAVSGWSVRDFTNELEQIVALEPDIVIVQLGIVECSRRILSQLEKRILARVPGSRRFTAFLHRHRQRVIRLRNRLRMDTRFFTPAEFELEMRRLVERLDACGAEVILVETPSFGPSYEHLHFPLINEDIELFNRVLRGFGSVSLQEPGDDNETIWIEGTVHLNPRGHRLVASRLLAKLRSRLAEAVA